MSVLTNEAIYEAGMSKLQEMFDYDPDLLETDEAEKIRDELDDVWMHLDPEVRREIEKRVLVPKGCIQVVGEQPA